MSPSCSTVTPPGSFRQAIRRLSELVPDGTIVMVQTPVEIFSRMLFSAASCTEYAASNHAYVLRAQTPRGMKWAFKNL